MSGLVAPHKFFSRESGETENDADFPPISAPQETKTSIQTQATPCVPTPQETCLCKHTATYTYNAFVGNIGFPSAATRDNEHTAAPKSANILGAMPTSTARRHVFAEVVPQLCWTLMPTSAGGHEPSEPEVRATGAGTWRTRTDTSAQ